MKPLLRVLVAIAVLGIAWVAAGVVVCKETSDQLRTKDFWVGMDRLTAFRRAVKFTNDACLDGAGCSGSSDVWELYYHRTRLALFPCYCVVTIRLKGEAITEIVGSQYHWIVF